MTILVMKFPVQLHLTHTALYYLLGAASHYYTHLHETRKAENGKRRNKELGEGRRERTKEMSMRNGNDVS